jgi:hypothetical protein
MSSKLPRAGVAWTNLMRVSNHGANLKSFQFMCGLAASGVGAYRLPVESSRKVMRADEIRFGANKQKKATIAGRLLRI